jgi:hypothetical protein
MGRVMPASVGLPEPGVVHGTGPALAVNAGGPAGLLDRKSPGPTPRLTAAHRAELATRQDQRGRTWRMTRNRPGS